MLTVDAIIRELGGPAKVGRALGATTEHVTTMRRRRSIPLRFWPALIDAARTGGLELDEAALVRINIAEKADKELSA